jgi:nitroimidazol reductase NimA-like FMN-containing flavoprotein (pyridoxamine 5'-phosphate oxidase superfamily)
MRSDIKNLILDNHVCVMATVSPSGPHCSLMSYVTGEDCREIYVATSKETKKYHNLLVNPACSLLIDSREKRDKGANIRALTITGTFQDSVEPQKKEAIRNALLKRHPDLHDFLTDPSVEIISIKIEAVQLLDGITDAYFEGIS